MPLRKPSHAPRFHLLSLEPRLPFPVAHRRRLCGGKGQSVGRILRWIAWLAGLVVIALLAMVILTPENRPRTITQSSRSPAPYPAGPTRSSGPADCTAPDFADAARLNAHSLATLAWAPFHRAEVGWETYAPHVASEIGSACAPESPAFARALSSWQRGHALPATGQLDAATFAVMNTQWERARPFVRLSQSGVCPDAPSPTELTWARPDEGYEGKPVQLRPAALAAYRRMVAGARQASPLVASDHRLLTIFSGYRSPEDDAASCDREGNCANVARALCSAHRTGLAMDLYLGAAPGLPPDTAADANRLYQSRTPVYAWLIAHAAEFGFVNYPFEPWHWEWAGRDAAP
jgi:zinc D-Ala-D-Ala carboxypeptidase